MVVNVVTIAQSKNMLIFIHHTKLMVN